MDRSGPGGGVEGQHRAGVDDVLTHVDGEVCTSFRRSDRPAPTPTSPQVEVTFSVTDATGRTSSDTIVVTCFPPFIGGW